MCTTFLLFLSMIFIKFAIRIIWNWFCSCYGKTCDCDAEGGAVKHVADGYESEDSVLTQQLTLWSARDVCVLGRSEGASLSKEYTSK